MQVASERGTSPSGGGLPTSSTLHCASASAEAQFARELDRALHRMHSAWMPLLYYVCGEVVTPLQEARVSMVIRKG